MVKYPIYINGMGVISIQNPLDDSAIFAPQTYQESYVRCVDPNFKEYFDPMLARRMSLIIKRAIITANYALKQAGVEMPDAVITGTGLGCVQDTEKFLDSMIRNDEKFLQPAFFIQSTHNTISSQIAINIGCKSYNNTYIHRGVSFENALTDALLQMNKSHVSNVLVTGNDEMTPSYFKLLNRLSYWKESVPDTLKIVHQKESSGSFAGEGSISLVLSKSQNSKSYAKIDDLSLFYKPGGINVDKISEFLKQNNLDMDDISLFMTGLNGDSENDTVYRQFFDMFGENRIGFYRNICGDFYTSSAFGIYAAAVCLKSQNVPEYLIYSGRKLENPKHILLYNHFKNKDHSLILLTKC